MDTHKPIWDGGRPFDTTPLGADLSCDVCIVGAGIAGLLIAERLSRSGLQVAVVDAGPVAGGESARTTAHLVTALDDRYTSLERMHGRTGAQIAAQSHLAAISHIETLVARLGIACGWRRLDGYLTVPPRHYEKRDEFLEAELAAARRCGLPVKRVDHLPPPWPGGLGPGLRFPDQAQVHPAELLHALAAFLLRSGVNIYTRTHVTHVSGGSDAVVETEIGPVVRCKHIVVATNTPINNLVAVHTKQSGYQTYVVALGIEAGSLPPVLLWDGLWGDDLAYHYVRLLHGKAEGEKDALIVGGEDHKTGQGPKGDEPYERLEEWARLHFPTCGPVERRWSGEVMEPADGLAYIGHNSVGRQNVYIVTGDSGNGMTHAGVAAMLIPDQILNKDNPWSKLYDPSRKIGFHALGEYLRENVNTVSQYADWLKRGDVASEEDIPLGSGAVLTRGLRHIAVYKDDHGHCTRLNARCTHLGGVVRWNEAEKTWDCPCHASRFDAHGRVIHGPAISHLIPDEEGPNVETRGLSPAAGIPAQS